MSKLPGTRSSLFGLAMIGACLATGTAYAQFIALPPGGGGGRGGGFEMANPCEFNECGERYRPRIPRRPPVVVYEQYDDFQEFPVEEAPPPRRKKVTQPKPTKEKQKSVKKPTTQGNVPVVAAADLQDRRVPDEVIVEIPLSVQQPEIDELAREQNIQQLGSQVLGLMSTRIHRCRITDQRSVDTVVQTLAADRRVASAQPNHLYTLQETTGAAPQYAITKLNLNEVHRITKGETALVAVIDSGIDAGHEELAGIVTDSFDAIGGTFEAHPHGTGMAGAIASHSRLMGTAPSAHILAVRAFAPSSNGGDGTTFDVVRGMDWAATKGAKVFNLSFAGPRDSLLSRAVQAALSRNIVVVAAVGNAGPKSPPLFPGAEPGVIAVTATDAKDGIMPLANRGSYVSVAAPGVDILLPAPKASYAVSSGTSVAAAYVSGIAALMLSVEPDLDGKEVAEILRGTARDLGAKGKDNDFGAGLADPLKALNAMAPVTQAVAAPGEVAPVR